MSNLTFFIKNYGRGDLVGIPSRRSATRKRGRNFMIEISKSVAAAQSIQALDILQHTRSVRDQSQLDAQARTHNIAGAFCVSLKSSKLASNSTTAGFLAPPLLFSF